MNDLIINPTTKTPEVNLRYVDGVIELKGISIPEDSKKFYDKVVLWLDNYVENPQDETRVVIGLEYFNTSTSRILLNLFVRLNELHKSGKSNVSTKWLYEEGDVDMLEVGQDYQRLVELPIALIAVDSL